MRKFDNVAIQKFTDLLSYENWDDVFQGSDVNEIFNNFHNTYLRIFNISFPIKKIYDLPKTKPWITNEIKTLCANKRNLYITHRNSNDPNIKYYYKKYCRTLSSTIEAAKKKYFNDKIIMSTNPSKTTWNIIKTATNKRNTTDSATSVNINNKLITNPTNIADAFNTYFSSVVGNLSNNHPGISNTVITDPLNYLKNNYSKPNDSLGLINTTTHEIDKIIRLLKCKDSHGYDEVSMRVIKISAPYILSPLTLITNKVLSTGVFPKRLKFSEVKPLYKKGLKTELSNYRPISLLPSFSKIIEKVIYKRVFHYLEKNHILDNAQFGFRESTSTNEAIYALLNTVLISLDKKNIAGGLFCDLHKAFDCVNHKILLNKLEFYGISGTANKLLQSYLESRYQRVVLTANLHHRTTSDWMPMTHGVPQGSVLGPLMFLVYINDLAATIQKIANPILFADDTSIIVTSTDVREYQTITTQVTSETLKWCQANLLTLNLNKTHFLQFQARNQKVPTIQIAISDIKITNVNSTKFLGITINRSISWKEQISELTSKLNQACYAIRTIKPLLSLEALRTIYFAYFHSVMTYGIIFWGNSHLSSIIFKIQKRALRIMTNKSKRESCRPLYKQLQILTLPSQYIFSLLIFVVKNKDLFLSNSEIHTINTCNNFNLHIPNTNLTLFQKGVLYSGCKIYNKLPPYIKSLSNDLKRFKSSLKGYLMERTLYSIDEFHQIT